MTGFRTTTSRRFAFLALALAAVLTSAVSLPAEAEAAHRKGHKAKTSHYKRRPPVIPADRYAAIVIDAVDGRVLSAENADKRLSPASLTKMMTLYLTFDAIRDGRLRKNTRIPVSVRASRQEPSALGLVAGSSIRVEDAILGLVTKSANDAAVALGEAIGGSEARFAQIMTARAQALGMTNTRFMNASGLYHPEQRSTARDMATLGQALLRDHPTEYRYFRTPRFTWVGRTFENHNRLMETYQGMDGIKTGYVRQSGFNLVASAVRGGRRLIGVVFGGRTTASRNARMAELLDDGFEKIRRLPPPVVAAADAPQFNAMGLALRDGEAYSGEGDIAEDRAVPAVATPTRIERPRTAVIVPPPRPQPRPAPVVDTSVPRVIPPAPAGGFAVQIGAFATPDAGMDALKVAQRKVSAQVARRAVPVVVPLITSRGTIYRARLTGLDRRTAERTCRALKGGCLILASR